MKIKNLILPIALTGGLAAFSSPLFSADPEPAFGGTNDVVFAQRLWNALKKSHLVGDNAINVYPFEGNQPHGAIQQVLDTNIKLLGKKSRVIVKRNHGGPDANIKSVFSDPEKHLKAVTVMFKRDAGYDEDNLNWFWVKYTPDGQLDKNPKGMKLAGRVAKGANKGCIACHQALGGKDLVTLTPQ